MQNVIEIDITDKSTWPEWLSISEVAQILRLSIPAVWKQTRDGSIKSKKFGSTIRINKENVILNINEEPEASRKSDVIGLQELCSFLKISRTTMYRILKKDKNFPKLAISGKNRFSKQDVIEYIKHNANSSIYKNVSLFEIFEKEQKHAN